MPKTQPQTGNSSVADLNPNTMIGKYGLTTEFAKNELDRKVDEQRIVLTEKIQLPTKDTIKKARIDAGLTQTQAAELIYKALRTWQQWEKGDREMDPAFFELFTIKVALLTERK